MVEKSIDTQEQRIIGRFNWGLLAPDDGTIVLGAGSAKELGDLLGLSCATISNNAARGARRKEEPYFGSYYAKWPKDSLPPEPIQSVEQLRNGGVKSTLSRESPCEFCGNLRTNGDCKMVKKCLIMKRWIGNKLRAMRVLCGAPEPGDAGR